MIRRANGISLWQYIATREALSWRTYITVTPIALGAAAFAHPDADIEASLKWMLAAAIGQIAAGAFLSIGRKVGSAASPRLAAICTLLIAYAVSGGIRAAIAGSFGLQDTTEFQFRVLAVAINMSVWSLIAGAVWQARKDYHRSLERALDQVSDLTDRASSDVPEPREVDQTRRRITAILDRYGVDDALSWSRELKEAIENDLRPLSHRIARGSARGNGILRRLRQLLWRSIHEPVPIGVVVSLSAVLAVSNSFVRYSPTDAVTSVAIYMILLLSGLLIVQLFRRFIGSVVAANAVIFVIFVLAIPASLFLAPTHWLPEPDPLQVALLFANANAIRIIALSIIKGAIVMARANVESIDEQLHCLDVVIEAGWRSSQRADRDLALYLHNTVQSQLTALQLEAELSDASLDSGRVDHARGLLGVKTLSSTANPLEELRNAMRSWAGLIDVEAKIDPSLVGDEMGLDRVCSFGQEAITNAVRHGEATSVSVVIDNHEGMPRCTVTDNGTWRDYSGSGPGLGLSQGLQVEVARCDGGTVITALA